MGRRTRDPQRARICRAAEQRQQPRCKSRRTLQQIKASHLESTSQLVDKPLSGWTDYSHLASRQLVSALVLIQKRPLPASTPTAAAQLKQRSFFLLLLLWFAAIIPVLRSRKPAQNQLFLFLVCCSVLVF